MSDGDEIERAALVLLEKAMSVARGERMSWLASRREHPQAVARCGKLLETMDRNQGRFATGAALLDAGAIRAPERLGAYRIVELIGQGGMGAVFRAVREAGDFEHEVAIKLIRPGLLSEAAVERFQRERQILARLVHPNIARLLDGGAAGDGSPFIVMEYVAGIPITRWAEERALALGDRLDIFLQVCGAVEYAHQNLVVHRDLTPANVLIGNDELPKLIDFGIAKPREDDLDSALTAANDRVDLSMTPGFAAPERLTGGATTTLADIYSLGRLLEALLDEWVSDPDLAAIISKASATLPEERYRTAGMLAHDLRRYLRGRAVEARGPSRRYRMSKFLKRNRRTVMASAAGIALLLAALIGTSLAYAGAEQARKAEAERFQQVRELANFMLFDLNDRLELLAGTTEARSALVVQARSYLESLADSPDPSPELRRDIARGYVRLALVQGVPGHPNVGDPGDAKTSLDEAERLLVSLESPRDPSVAAPLALARAYRSLILLHAESKPQEAAAQTQAALAALAAVPAPARSWPWFDARSLVRRAQLESADLAFEIEEIERLAALVLAEIPTWPQARRDTARARLDRAIAAQYLGTADYNAARHGDALAHYEEADRIYAALELEAPNDPIVLYWRGWNAYYGHAVAGILGHYTRSAALLGQARGAGEKLLAIEANASIVTFVERLQEAEAELLVNQGRHAEGIALQREIVEDRRAKVAAVRSSGSLNDLAYSQAILGALARRASDRALACASWTEAEAVMAELDGRDALYGFLESMRGGIAANLERCAAGVPASALRPLS